MRGFVEAGRSLDRPLYQCEHTELSLQAKIKPAFNQVELNFSCAQPELLQWSKNNGILLESYSPLGSDGAKERELPEMSAWLHDSVLAEMLTHL